MKRMKITMMALVLLLSAGGKVLAQQEDAVFVPHWYLQPMVGGSLHLGENDLSDRLSPAAQLSIGRQLSPLWGLRLSGAGWEARNALAWPDDARYKWNYVQGTLDVTLSLTDLIGGYNPHRRLGAYALLGGGAALGWNNKEAQSLSVSYGGFGKLWDGSRLFLAVRGGLGASYRVGDRLSLLIEGNASMLPDHFNSKVGKDNSSDWQLSLLAGVKIDLGKRVKYVTRQVPQPTTPEPVPTPVVVTKPEPAPQPEPTPEPQPVVEKQEPMVVDIYYRINSARISSEESVKLDALADYMQQHADTKVNITGYADKQTGTSSFNKRISRRRANAVQSYLQQRGIAKDRMTLDALGDTRQPRTTAKENRVVICVVDN